MHKKQQKCNSRKIKKKQRKKLWMRLINLKTKRKIKANYTSIINNNKHLTRDHQRKELPKKSVNRA